MDVSLPGLIKMPGMIKWKVKKNGKYYDGFEKDAGLSESMFPPSNISSLNMERCIRVYPQMQNTGGFFIAVLKKVADYGVVDTGKIPKEKKPTYQHSQKRPLSSSNEAEEAVNEDELDGSVAIKKKKATITNSHDHDEPQLLDKQIINAAAMDDVSPMKKKKKVGWGGLNEEPFVFLKPDNGTLHECLFQYGLGDHPAVPKDSFLVRCAEEKNDYRHIYMVSKAAKQVLTSRNAESIKVVNTGVKAFTRIGGTKAK
jgi:tRNA (cytosine34-C5)-methyltransferase